MSIAEIFEICLVVHEIFYEKSKLTPKKKKKTYMGKSINVQFHPSAKGDKI